MKMLRTVPAFSAMLAVGVAGAMCVVAGAEAPHFEGFEDPGYTPGGPVIGGDFSTAGDNWSQFNSNMYRVVSGTDGITSADGAAHAKIEPANLPPAPDDFTGIFSRLGGYDCDPFGNGFIASLDVYIDLSDPGVAGNTYGFDVSVAAQGDDCNHQRDFIFHAAADASDSVDTVLIGGSNNSNGAPQQNLETGNHYEITASGWYTFEWEFRDAGDDTLAVDLNLRDDSGSLLFTETRNDSSDVLDDVVRRNRYMWFTFIDAAMLHIDNTSLFDGPPPAVLTLNSDDDCYNATQGQVVVAIDMTAADDMIVGGQFFLEYDNSVLDFVGVDPGDPPFTNEIFENADEGAGTIDYAVGVPQGDVGTMADTTMAYITFDVLTDACDVSELVEFRTGPLPTRLTNVFGDDIEPELNDLGSITIDQTPPAITCPSDVVIECIEDAAPGLPFGETSGGTAIYYNDNGGGEVPSNQSYFRSQCSATNTNAAQFTFDSTPLTGAGPVTWAGIFNELGQYGFDLILPLPTADGSNPAPALIAVDNTDSTPGGAVPAGPVLWAINDYKGGSPNGPCNPATAPVNSVVRGPSPPVGTEVVIFRNDVTQSGSIFTSHIEGKVVSDGLLHWFDPSELGSNGDGTTDMADFFLTGEFYFEGVLTYDVTTDSDPLMDFYEGTVTITANAPSSVTGFATATDNCTLFPTISFSDVDNGGSGCAGDPLIITRTWTATDDCGNESTCVQTITVEDTTPPTFLSVPDDVVVNAEAGSCEATVSVGTPEVTDNCIAGATVVGTRDDGQPLNDPYPAGTTVITWEAEDACGNLSFETTEVTVNDVNELVVAVELQGVWANSGPLTVERCITFELSTPGCGVTETVEEVLVFHSTGNGDPASAVATVLVPCGNYDCITARDTLHTLQSRDDDDFAIVGTQYVADFTSSGGDNDALIGGNLNDDGFIDILDFGLFIGNLGPVAADTDCSTAAPHADISGDGNVGTADFTFIQINFLVFGEDDCCAPLAIGSGERIGGWDRKRPLRRASVEWLNANGMRHLTVADLNHDGWVDEHDIAAYMQGVRP